MRFVRSDHSPDAVIHDLIDKAALSVRSRLDGVAVVTEQGLTKEFPRGWIDAQLRIIAKSARTAYSLAAMLSTEAA
jgi:hypothetical protein